MLCLGPDAAAGWLAQVNHGSSTGLKLFNWCAAWPCVLHKAVHPCCLPWLPAEGLPVCPAGRYTIPGWAAFALVSVVLGLFVWWFRDPTDENEHRVHVSAACPGNRPRGCSACVNMHAPLYPVPCTAR